MLKKIDADEEAQDAEKKPKHVSFLKNRDKWIRDVVADTNLSHPTVRVAIHIAMRMDGRDTARGAWPSVVRISERTGVSARSVLNALNQLEGYVDREQPGRQSGKRYIVAQRKRNAGNKYWLNFHWE